jgi:hypothetical protein
MTSLIETSTHSLQFMEFPEEILEIEGNDECADCGAPKPSWASKNLGVLICIKCSGTHFFL